MAVVAKTTQFEFLTKQIAALKVVDSGFQNRIAQAESNISTLSSTVAANSSALQNLKINGISVNAETVIDSGDLKLGSDFAKDEKSLLSSITVDSSVAAVVSAIDAVLVTVNGSINENAEGISVLNGKVAQNITDISSLKTRMSTAEAGVAAVDGKIATAKGEVEEAYKAADAVVEGKVTAEETRAKGEEARIEGLVTAEAERADAAEKALDAKIATAQDEIDAVEGRMDTAEADITSIKTQLGGDGESSGNSLVDRVAAVEDATNVDVTATNPIVENVGTTEVPNYQINADYMPDLKFQGKSIREDAPNKFAKSINFVGVGNVSIDDDGNVTIRLGENLNSSSFNTTDSKETVGTASASYTTTGTRKLADGTSKNIWMKGTNTVTVTTSGKIHFDDTTSKFKVTVNDKVFNFGPITGNKDAYTDAENAGAKLVVTNWGAEGKTATGATGYSANVKFTISVEELGLPDGMVSFAVEHVSATGATIGAKFTKNDVFYLVNDTDTKADVTSASVSLSNVVTKTLSGVSYIVSASVNYSAAVANVGVPATNGSSTSPVTFNANNWADDKTANVAYNATSATATGSLVNGQYTAASTSVAVSAKNINGSDATASATLNIPLLVNNVAVADDTNVTTTEIFKSESQRLKNDCKTAWVSTVSLASTDGAEGLMVANGQLKYPAGNFTGTNDGLGGIVGANQPNYTGLTGERSYVRRFTKAGSWDSAVITLTHTASISAFIDAAASAATKMIVEVSKDGTKWYDINTSGIGTARDLTTSTTSSSFTFQFTDGKASGGVWFRIRMASSSVTAVITKVTMA